MPATLYLLGATVPHLVRRARARGLSPTWTLVIAPTTPYPAPPIGARATTIVDGVEVVTREHLGVFTQPWSFIGLPVLSVPIAGLARGAVRCRSGVQLIGSAFMEAHLLRTAARLEAEGVVAAPTAHGAT